MWHHLLRYVSALTAFAIVSPQLSAEVEGRYVRYEAPLAGSMEIMEIEITSEGENLLLKHPELITLGLGEGYYGPVNAEEQARTLTDGVNDPNLRGAGINAPVRYNTYVAIEIDLGQVTPISELKVYRSRWRNKVYKDYGLRVATVLDEDRNVVHMGATQIYGATADDHKQVVHFPMSDTSDNAFDAVGKVVPAGAINWISPVEALALLGEPMPESGRSLSAEEQAQLDAFEQRNSPENIAELSHRFFQRIDLSRPHLSAAAAMYESGEHAEALNAFARVFLERMSYLDKILPSNGAHYERFRWEADPGAGYVHESRDYVAGLVAVPEKEGYRLEQLVPGVATPQLVKIEEKFDTHTYPSLPPSVLLKAYAATGDDAHRLMFEALADDLGMHFQDHADREGNVRDFFPLPSSNIAWFKTLRLAYRDRPELVQGHFGASLARMLIPFIDEVPAMYWRLARKTVFNHQFNSTPNHFLAEVFQDFYAGQRWRGEVAQHWDRLWTLALHRDGSMVEVSDEGHFGVTIGTASYMHRQLTREKADWFTPAVESLFLDQFREAGLYLIRHMAPDGREYRPEIKEPYSYRFWTEITAHNRSTSWRSRTDLHYDDDVIPHTMFESVLRNEPEARAIIDTVFGRGHDSPDVPKETREIVTNFFEAEYQGPPATLSDWMPYTGIHTLRRGWEPTDSLIEMLTMPPGGSGNIAFVEALADNWLGPLDLETQFKYIDHGQPLLFAPPLRIDGKYQHQQWGRQGQWPGSKTERLVEAVEMPADLRWLSSPRFDFAEAEYDGAYQVWNRPEGGRYYQSKGLVEEGDPVHATARRQIIQLRPERLFIVVDRVKFDDVQPHEVQAQSVFLPTKRDRDAEAVVTLDVDEDERVFSVAPDDAGLRTHHFGQDEAQYSVDRLKTWRSGDYDRLNYRWDARGETVYVRLLSPQERGGEDRLSNIRDLSNGDCAGFEATLNTGETVRFHVARSDAAAVELGDVSATAEGLLILEHADGIKGLAFGVRDMDVAGDRSADAGTDFEFRGADGGGIELVEPILRPIKPVVFEPRDHNVFTDTLDVELISGTPEAEIHYTTDGSEPTRESPRCEGPVTIREDTHFRARAFRPGVERVPFTADGTRASVVSHARFFKRDFLEAEEMPATEPGLNYAYLEGRWFELFSYADRMEAESTGVTDRLFDVSMRQTDEPFGVRYHGYLEVPEDGVYTFHAPEEFVRNIAEPGYDLRVYVGGEEWDLGQTWHARGTWSVPLRAGKHRFMVTFADARAKDLENQRIDYWEGYPRPGVVWKGETPTLEISSERIERQPLPNAWLSRSADDRNGQ